ncbi:MULTISPECIES: acetyl-CoA carboxylase biotin carboxyl carrier protein [Magnetospirillum]|uniref:Biotin carboxyl carrier protein of acetyl-CoA carboxylase n=1 Tax=Magnetospirillum moscoviense TaxID=1437059 RepID=A0A178N1R8_9PROT|nr:MULTISPECIES: acetyl-CoA carboxylase biotin carboxyl carrier protein subunit [Magnetospirillum]MBF0323456.1 acetyl-CoA carboxylase biotin carboxyl carrier protein subunit [Alphaproteobacteria bacterium]OAN64769.1 acetyl-CoA carboxylase biotin carboxyl carrier protein subunit [Magnetospirillum moscoviense]CAA7611681.1 Acetyl-CoA carboxylase, biotin carboxyl carrier protein subunit [Magnetospirillum sp. LM-5]
MATKSIDSELVRSLATLLDETNLTEIEYDTGSIRIRVARQGAPVQHYAPAMPAVAAAPVAQPGGAAVDDANHPGAVTSPMVGVSYLSPEPGAPKFVEVGATVSEGQTLMLIEAMKTFNPIRAPRGGKLVRFLVTDGQPVEFGEPLAVIE